MLDRKRQHQRAAPPILRHLAGRIRIAFHKGHDTGRGEGTVEHRTARRPNMRKVVSYAPAPLHQLHLLFVDADDTAVRVGRILVADHKTVRQRSDLQIIADTGHRAALRNHILEIFQQVVNFGSIHRVGIFSLDPRDLVGNSPVHLLGRFFVNFSERVFQRILAPWRLRRLPHKGTL